MLLSPGHSPRHLSSPSPSPSVDIQPSGDATSSSFTSSDPPQRPRKRAAAVLDEDTYVAAIEKIIERDYFPDIPKLRDRLDWLEAVRSRDPVLIRDAQLKILERRRGRQSNLDPEGKIRTPGSMSLFRNNSISVTPFEFEKTQTPGGTGRNSEGGSAGGEDGIEGAEGEGPDISVSLDQFLRRYTSEDNDSFSKILEKVNRKKREKYGYLLEGEKTEDGGVKSIEEAKRDRITDGYGTSYQPASTLEGWKYAAKNLLMYHPADNGEAPLTEDEKTERVKGLTKEINKSSTRYHGKFMDMRPKDDQTAELPYTTVAGMSPSPFSLSDRERDKTKKYDLEDLRKTPNKFYVESEKKADNGYSFVKTPSPAPGVDDSPFITWGEIEGTPLRLDEEDTPVDIGGSADGPHFKIPCPPTRDLKAHSLSREASKKLRERSQMFQKPPLPSPARSGSASPSIRTLSPAAQKFVRNAIAKTSSTVDESLRASYRGASPMNTPKSTRSTSRLGRGTSPPLRSPSVKPSSSPSW